MISIQFSEKHKKLLAPTGKTLAELQAMKGDQLNNFITANLLPHVCDGTKEDAKTAEDIITMITEWEPGQTEGILMCVLPDEEVASSPVFTAEEEKRYANMDFFKVSVFFAMSDEQAKREGVPPCLSPAFPESTRIYHIMMELDDSLCIEKHMESGNWERIITTTKDKVTAILSLWYTEGIGEWNYQKILDRIDGDTVYIIGFGD